MDRKKFEIPSEEDREEVVVTMRIYQLREVIRACQAYSDFSQMIGFFLWNAYQDAVKRREASKKGESDD